MAVGQRTAYNMVLPFVGRTSELKKLLDFWRESLEIDGLRGFLLSGEAGVGKSRLVDELVPMLEERGGVVVRVKVFPGYSADLASLLFLALEDVASRLDLLRIPVDRSLGSASNLLRRLARLRPTLLIIEDLHLLEGEQVVQLSTLLTALSDENLPLLCSTRPVETPARELLTPHLAGELVLQGFGTDEISELWSRMVKGTIDAEMAELLRSTTLGNPLAVRLALTGAMRSNEDQNPVGVFEQLGGLAHAITLFRQSASTVSQGLVLNLNEIERCGAQRLSWLGEVFSLEAAIAIFADREKAELLLKALRAKGIVAESSAALRPIFTTQASEARYAFTHSLLHRRLTEETELDIDALLRALATHPPLYSIEPLVDAGRHAERATVPSEVIAEAICTIIRNATVLDHSRLWRRTDLLVDAAQNLYRVAEERMVERDRVQAEYTIEWFRARHFLKRTGPTEEVRKIVQRLLDITSTVETHQQGVMRIGALAVLFMLDRNDGVMARYVTRAVDAVTKSFPSTFNSLEYVLSMHELTAYCFFHTRAGLRKVEGRMQRMAELGVLTQSTIDQLDAGLRPFFLFLHDSPEELAQREDQHRTLYGDLRRFVDPLDPASGYRLRYIEMEWFYDVNYVDDLYWSADRLAKESRDMGLVDDEFTALVMKLAARIPIGLSMETLEGDIRDLYSSMILARQVHSDRPETLFPIISSSLIACGFRDLVSVASEVFDIPVERLPLRQQILVRELDQIPIDSNDPMLALIRMARGGDIDAEQLRESVDLLLRGINSSGPRAITVYALIELLEKIPDATRHIPDLGARLHQMLTGLLEGCAQSRRRLVMPIRHILRHYAAYLSPADQKAWKKRLEELEHERLDQRATWGAIADHARTRITLIGMIAVKRGDAEPVSLRGARMRSLMGLLAADLVQNVPFDALEFTRIAAAEEDPEKAAGVVKITTHRLREVLGDDAIAVRGGRPYLLAPERVDVDIIDLSQNLTEAEQALRTRALGRSIQHLLHVYDMIGNEVLFPSLYDPFFEALRDEYEERLRRLTLRVIAVLREEEDSDNAERLLRQALFRMEGDEELTELLQNTLVQQGRLAEAERLRMR